MKILVTEDDPLIRRALRDLLEVQGYELLFAANMREGVDLLSKEPELVLCDLAMHNHDGFELIAALRAKADFQALPIIVLSTKSGRAELHRAMESGADDFVSKPLQSAELMKAIKTQIARSKRFVEPLDAFKDFAAEGGFTPLSEEALEHLLQIQRGADLLLSRAEQRPTWDVKDIAARIKFRTQLLHGMIHRLIRHMQVKQPSRPSATQSNRSCEKAKFSDSAC